MLAGSRPGLSLNTRRASSTTATLAGDECIIFDRVIVCSLALLRGCPRALCRCVRAQVALRSRLNVAVLRADCVLMLPMSNGSADCAALSRASAAARDAISIDESQTNSKTYATAQSVQSLRQSAKIPARRRRPHAAAAAVAGSLCTWVRLFLVVWLLASVSRR